MLSRLAVFCLDDGSVETVFTTARHIEAPNWSVDGASLIVNGTGRLYRVPLATPALQEIDTGFAIKINNDHGVSPDGKTLVISEFLAWRELYLHVAHLGRRAEEGHREGAVLLAWMVA